MVITIRQGDEHRAKIETNFLTTDFFADVYTKADALIGEITQELQTYKKERANGKNNYYLYHGMVNNIIIFCGARGQGKTSALQSIAQYLDKIQTKGKVDKNPDVLPLGKACNNIYEVIDSIDPSAMENEESVLRILISRLFFRLEQRINNLAGKSEDDKEFAKKKGEIVALFQACYTNIDYIKSGKETDYDQDDLDTLSQLGSSARLKANMHDLIETYLEMMLGKEECGGKKGRYLVIPIDDADLATKKVFQLCEDIRNYLSIPNVIILMAADYEQLVQATYQKYLKQYKVMWKAGKFSGHQLHVVEDCHEMAAKYLEKVFPVAHRIDLPQIEYMLMEGYKSVTFEYIVLDGNGEKKSAFKELCPEYCTNLQDQLLELLYKRTGLVFMGKMGKMHPFLPHTLRELAHWVKMLYGMYEIDCDDVYKKFQYYIDVNEEAEKLKDNILRMKQFFLNYWCEKNLDISAVKVLRKIDNATKRNQMVEVRNHLYNYCKRMVQPAEPTYQEIIHGIVEMWFEGESYFQEAVYIYYTIFLNEWFAMALEDKLQFEEIVCFVERAVYLADYKNKKYRGKYNIMQFDVDVDILHEILGDSIGQAAKKCLSSFCAAVRNNRIRENISIDKIIDKRVYLNTEIDSLEFNVFRPFIMLLKESMDEVKESNKPEDSSEDELVQEKVQHIRMPYLITARNIIANYDAQWQIRNIVGSWYETNTEESEFVPLSEQVLKLYEVMEQKVDVPKGRPVKEIAQIYENTGAGADDKKTIKQLFLCNRENLSNYLLYLKDALGEIRDEIKRDWSNVYENYVLNKLNTYNENEMQSFYKRLESSLEKIEYGSSKSLIEWEELELIVKMLPAAAKRPWKQINSCYCDIVEWKEQLMNLKIEIENRIHYVTSMDSGHSAEKSELIKPSAENRNETDFAQDQIDNNEGTADE